MLLVQMVFVVVSLLLFSYFDLRKKEIPIWLLVITAVIGLLIIIISRFTKQDNPSFLKIIFDFIPGLSLGMISLFTKGKVGMGDAFVLLIYGPFWGVMVCFGILFLAFLMTSFYSVFLLVLKKGHRNTEIAFLPFLALSYLLIVCLPKCLLGGVV